MSADTPLVATILKVRVQPRASKNEVVGNLGDEIKVRLKAPPVDGAANTELIRFLAKRLGVPRTAVRIEAGRSARSKRVRIDHAPGDDPARRLLDG